MKKDYVSWEECVTLREVKVQYYHYAIEYINTGGINTPVKNLYV